MRIDSQSLMNKAADALRWASQAEGEPGRQLLHLMSAFAYVAIIAEYEKDSSPLKQTADKLSWEILDGVTAMCVGTRSAAANPGQKLKSRLLK